MNSPATAIIGCLCLLSAPVAFAQRGAGTRLQAGTESRHESAGDAVDNEHVLLIVTFGAAAVVLLMLIGVYRSLKRRQSYTLSSGPVNVKVGRSAFETASSETASSDALSIGAPMPDPSTFIVLHNLESSSEDGLQSSSETDEIAEIVDFDALSRGLRRQQLGDAALITAQEKACDGGKAGMVRNSAPMRASMLAIPVVTAGGSSAVTDDSDLADLSPAPAEETCTTEPDDGVELKVTEAGPKGFPSPRRARTSTAAGGPGPVAARTSMKDSAGSDI